MLTRALEHGIAIKFAPRESTYSDLTNSAFIDVGVSIVTEARLRLFTAILAFRHHLARDYRHSHEALQMNMQVASPHFTRNFIYNTTIPWTH
jgi:hypothetical protein